MPFAPATIRSRQPRDETFTDRITWGMTCEFGPRPVHDSIHWRVCESATTAQRAPPFRTRRARLA
jgi:hypothetical protein